MKGGWTRHREGLRALFQFACDTVLDGADLYNAGKHGLAILPGERGTSLGDGKLISVSGPSLTVIEPFEVDDEERWAKTTRWIRYQRSVIMTFHISDAIRSLWACGKQRHTGEGDMARIHIFDVDRLAKAMLLGGSEGLNVDTVRHVLFDEIHPMWTSNPASEEEGSK